MDNNLIGKKVRLIPTPKNKYSSSNIRRNSNSEVYEIYKVSQQPGSSSLNILYIKNLKGKECGWVYDYETIPAASSIEELETKIKEYELAISESFDKLKYLKDTCQTEFDEKTYELHCFLRLRLKKDINLTETVNAVLDITK